MESPGIYGGIVKSPFFDTETFVGDKRDPDIEDAQELANTQDQDQDEDPETSDDEKARAWELSGLSPEDFADDETSEPEEPDNNT